MAEPTMEEYMMRTREDYGSGVARPNFNKDTRFELKGQFLKDLREHTFSGSQNKDANEHIERVLEIVDLFTTPDVTQDQLMLCVLPITLTRAASRWLRNEPSCLITTWKIIKGKFLIKYCPPSRSVKKMEEINNFQQELDETLYQAWERFKERLLRCPQHYLTSMQEVILFDKGLYVPTRQILDSKGGVPKMSAADAKNPSKKWLSCELCNGPHYTKDCPLKEEGKTFEEAYYTRFGVPFPQAGRYRAAAPRFYQRDNENSSYQERRQTMEESLNKFMAEAAKRHDVHSSLIKEILASMDVLQERGSGSLPSSTETNPKDYVKSITTTEEAETLKEDEKMPLIELIQAIIPFPGCLKENVYDEKEVLKELKKLQVNSTESATSLRRLLKEKSRIEEEIKATMKVHCLTIIKDALPPKEKDLGIFTLPCSINNMCFDKALADLGASVSVMPYSTFTSLGLGKLAPTKLIIELADRTVKRPKGIAENVLVRIDKFVFPVDFIVLDMPEDIKIPLILRRLFLSNAHAKIDVFKRNFSLRIENDKIVFKSDSPTSNIINKVYVLGLRERMELDLEARLMGEALDLDPKFKEGEIIDEQMVDVVKIRDDDEIAEKIDEYPRYEHVNANFFLVLSINVMSRNFYNSIMKEKIEYTGKNEVEVFMNVPIFVGNFSIVIDFATVETMDAYRDKDMGDVIVGKPFCRVVNVEAKRFYGFITIHD
ncbi:hypothetical protein Tco_0422908, partial [Tanacetum coccineum]